MSSYDNGSTSGLGLYNLINVGHIKRKNTKVDVLRHICSHGKLEFSFKKLIKIRVHSPELVLIFCFFVS